MENRRLLLFFVLSLAILLGWQWLMPSPARRPPAPAPTPAAPVASAATQPAGVPGLTPSPTPTGAAANTPAPVLEAAPPMAAAAEERVVVDTPELRAVFTNRGAQLLSFQLKEYRDEKGQPLELIRSREEGVWPLGLVGPDLRALPLDGALFAVRRERDRDGHEVLRFEYRGPLGNARKVVRMLEPDGLLGLEVEASTPGWGLVLGPGVRNPGAKELESTRQPRQAIYRAEGEVEIIPAPGTEGRLSLPVGTLSWAGVEDNYFLSVLIPESPIAAVLVQPVALQAAAPGRPYRFIPFDKEEDLPAAERELPRDLRIVVRPRGQLLTGTAYFGAKEYERLVRLPWGLEESLQWGIWGFLSRPLLWALLWIHDHMVPNYGWAIALLTLGLRVLLFPLTWTSQKSMGRMQELQPRMQAIRQKHRGKLRDKNGRMDLEAQRRMNEEIQALFKSEGANPYGGCLPIVAQIPIFFALFTMLRSAVELRGAPWVGWIYDLSLAFPDVQGAASIGYFLLPVAMGATQVYQTRLTPMSGDPMQRRLMQFFPWIFTAFSFGFPAGLVLYWTVNNVVTILQTIAFMRLKKRDEAKGKRRKPREGKGERS